MRTGIYDTIEVNASAPYKVVIGSGILDGIGQAVSKDFRFRNVAILADDFVAGLYAQIVTNSFETAGIKCFMHTFQHGEQSKRIETVLDFIAFMSQHGITRDDAVVALGGGVTGDMAGFASAIYLRGIPYIQIPTTLLAMADSSVGGKTAVDTSFGKNLIGAFHQPCLVWADTDTLKTLPQDILRDGYAEVIKYGVLFDRSFFDSLEPGCRLPAHVAASVCFKKNVVEADEQDHGQRALLNFGHTIGHALEKLSQYSLSHGQAVAIGMVAEAKIAAHLGMPDCSGQIRRKLEQFGFNTDCPFDADLIYGATMSDKKRTADGITLILPESIGHCVLQKLSAGEFLQVLEQIWN